MSEEIERRMIGLEDSRGAEEGSVQVDAEAS